MLIAAALIIVSILAATLTLSTSRAGVIEKALTAINRGQVVHLRLVDQRTVADVVDLRSGKSKPVRVVIDEWIRHSSPTVRTQASVNGNVIQVSTAHGSAEAQVLRFAKQYRQALRQRSAQVIDSHERGLRWLQFSDGESQTVRVGLGRGYEPTIVRFSSGASFTVANFDHASPTPVGAGLGPDLGAASVASSHPINPNALPGPFSGRVSQRLSGLPLVRTDLLQIKLQDGVVPALSAVYGTGKTASQLPRRYLRVAFASHPLAALGWSSWYVTPAGQVWLSREGLPTGFIDVAGLYISIQSSTGRPTLLAALRVLYAKNH